MLRDSMARCIEHYDICSTSYFHGHAGDAPIRSEHPDLELLFVLDPEARRPTSHRLAAPLLRMRQVEHEVQTGTLLAYNGREPHVALAPADYRHASLTISEAFLAELLAPLDVAPENLALDRVSSPLSPEIN